LSYQEIDMKNNVAVAPFNTLWNTASFGDEPDTSPMELSALSDHVQVCHATKSKLFNLQCKAHSVHSFLAGRFVTSIAVVGLVMMALTWVM
jgi:hypothetical protein